MSAFDRAILPKSIRSIFRQLVEKGGLNIDHPSRPGLEWAKFHYGHPNECLSDLERPRVFLYSVGFSDQFANLCEDRVQVSATIGVQIDCSKFKTGGEYLEDLWYRIRLVLSRAFSQKMNFDITVSKSSGAEETFVSPKLADLGIINPEVISSISTQFDGKILRYQGQLLFEVYFKNERTGFGAFIPGPIIESVGSTAVQIELNSYIDILLTLFQVEFSNIPPPDFMWEYKTTSAPNYSALVSQNTNDAISISGLPDGSYNFRMRYETAQGRISPYSNILTVAIGAAPSGVGSMVIGSTFTVS